MSFGLDYDCGWFSIVCRARFGHQEEREIFGSVSGAVSPALETEPWMPMRDVTEHEKETERARRGLLSTMHVDIETSCKMGGFYIGRSKRVSFDGTLSMERQARKVQRLRNETAAGGLAVRVKFGNLESRSISWEERPSLPPPFDVSPLVGKAASADVLKARQTLRRKPASGSS